MQDGLKVRLVAGMALTVAWVTTGFGADAAASAAQHSYVRTIYLIRHGAYDADARGTTADGPALVTLGIAQARLTAARFAGMPGKITSLAASTMTRAQETAAVIRQTLTELTVRPAPLLRECTPRSSIEGVMRQVSAEEAAACEEQLNEAFATYFVPAHGGMQNDVLVCHGNVIRYFVTKALGVDTRVWLGMSVAHASITVIRVNPDGTFKVLAVGDIGHIPPNMQSGTSDGDPQLVVPALKAAG